MSLRIGWRAWISAAAALLCLAAPATQSARAEILPGPSQVVPDNLGIGDSALSEIDIFNSGGTTVGLTSVKVTPSCGAKQGDPYPCPSGLIDLDVFSLGAPETGTGDCEGVSFSVAESDATTGEVTFTPQSAVSIGSNGCSFKFPVTALRLPDHDELPGTPGITTVERIEVTAQSGTTTLTGHAYPQVTIFAALPKLTPLLPASITTSDPLTPRVDLTGVTYGPGTPSGTLNLALRGPGGCDGPIYALLPATVTGPGTYGGPTFISLPPGAYGLAATYVPALGDEGNRTAALNCGSSGTLFTVTTAPPPRPSPPGPGGAPAKKRKKCKRHGRKRAAEAKRKHCKRKRARARRR